jgi:hypothetical protein
LSSSSFQYQVGFSLVIFYFFSISSTSYVLQWI